MHILPQTQKVLRLKGTVLHQNKAYLSFITDARRNIYTTIRNSAKKYWRKERVGLDVFWAMRADSSS